jgi:hypothetical protein
MYFSAAYYSSSIGFMEFKNCSRVRNTFYCGVARENSYGKEKKIKLQVAHIFMREIEREKKN